MNQWKDGIISLTKNMTVMPGYRFEDFQKTHYYCGQDGIKIIYLDDKFVIDKHAYMVDLFFRNGALYALSLICCDRDFSMDQEPERKKVHDAILERYHIDQSEAFLWGDIVSKYDARANISSITFYYRGN